MPDMHEPEVHSGQKQPVKRIFSPARWLQVLCIIRGKSWAQILMVTMCFRAHQQPCYGAMHSCKSQHCMPLQRHADVSPQDIGQHINIDEYNLQITAEGSSWLGATPDMLTLHVTAALSHHNGASSLQITGAIL